MRVGVAGRNLDRGLIAILDALGASLYFKAEIERFLDSRRLLLELLKEKAEDILPGRLSEDRLKVFTFNDTIVIVYRTVSHPSLDQVESFCSLLRVFAVRSLEKSLLFRGSVAIGDFYGLDDETNTVMGPAVSDAAAWYEQADWIGINTTPRATLLIQALQEGSGRALEHVLIDYAVPLKSRSPEKLKAINWPKGFYVKGLRPDGAGTTKRRLLELLGRHEIPRGTESKYSNAVEFFDYVVSKLQLGKKAKSNG